MKHFTRHLIAFLLTLAMVLSLLPTVAFAADSASDDLWADIIAYENDHIIRTRGVNDTVTAADYAALSGDIAEMVMASDDYKPGTCTYDGTNAMFFWEDADGEPQGYSPELRARFENGSKGTPSTSAEDEYVSYATKGGTTTGKDVYVIGPWYGKDSNFTNQYRTEGKSIASATGGTFTLYSSTNATIDKVAGAIESGAVVIFDSHGTTDYSKDLSYNNPGTSSAVSDCVTQANTSYLTLSSGTGLTTADKKAVTGTFGRYYHAYSFQSNMGTCYCVDGTVIANHMTQNAPNNMVWMAICLGMATTGLEAPMREKGVEVVYGYSQSVSFNGDYAYEEDFWTSMKSGSTVAEAAASMKSANGKWDPSYASNSYYNTVTKARKYFVAFPVVVSSEDVYPGQHTSSSNYGADSVQTVRSTWTLTGSTGGTTNPDTGTTSYTVSAVSNNTSYGTVSVSGNTITCVPSTGYYVASASVTSGSGTCTVNDDNTVTVNPTSNCTVTVTFAAKTAITISFNNGADPINTAVDEVFTLPSYSGTVPAGYSFVGWANQEVSSDTTTAPTYYIAGKSYTSTGSIKLYALFARTDGAGSYVKVTSTPSSLAGDYLIVYEDESLIFDGSLTALDVSNNYRSVTISNGSISTADGDPYCFTIGSDGTIRSKSGYYIGTASNANGLNTSATTKYTNTITVGSDGNAVIKSQGGAYLRFNTTSGQDRFRFFRSTSYANQKAVQLYAKQGSSGATYYTTSTGSGSTETETHTATYVAATAATCTAAGNKVYYYCAECTANKSGTHYGKYYSNQAMTSELASVTVAATGHTVVTDAAVAATCATAGKTEGSHCSVCGAVIVAQTVIPATGKHTFTEYAQNDANTHLAACSVCGDVVEEAHSFTASVSGDTTTYTCSKCGYSYTSTAARCTVSFSVPTGVSAVASIDSVGGASITLPTAGDVSGYTFCGWTTAAVDPESTSKPTVLTGSYQPTADITLYALYSRTVSGSGSTGYARFTGSSIENGDYVIVSAATGSALTASAANNWLKAGSTYSGDSIASPDEADVWTITNGVISAKNGNGSIYSSAAKKIALSSTSSTVWSFTNNSGVWTISNSNVGQLSYNSSGGWRPYSGGYGSDKTFVLYRAGAASTTYYTTNPTVSDGSLTDENLNFFGKTVIFEADFSIKYYVPKAVVDTYDSVYVSVTKSVYDADGNVTGKKTTKVDVTDYNSGYNAYGFKFAGIAAAEVGSNVDATVYGVKDGKTYEGATQSGYSVKQYCYNTLSKANTTAANKRVLVDFLNYASAAQVYFNINTKNLVNAELTDEQKAFGTATVAAIGNDRADGTVANATVAVSGCTLIFEGKIMMKFVFDPATYLKNGGSLSDLSVVVKDAEGKVLKTFAAADFEDYGTRKSVVFDGLASTEMRKAVTFQVMVGDTAVSNSRTYSIQTYAYSKQNDAAQGTLVQEMIKYGDSMVAWKIG